MKNLRSNVNGLRGQGTWEEDRRIRPRAPRPPFSEKRRVGRVSPDDLNRLGSDQAVDLFRDLLRMEADAIGVDIQLRHILTAREAKARIIDVEVMKRQVPGGQGLIKYGLTRYQIIAGQAPPIRKSEIEDLLFMKEKNELMPGVKKYLSEGGTFVLVLFGRHPTDVDDQEMAEAMKENLEENGVSLRGAIEVWKQSRLVTLLSSFPSLCLQVRGNRRVKALS